MKAVLVIAFSAAVFGWAAPAQAQLGSAGTGGYDDYTGGMSGVHTIPRSHHVTQQSDPETYAEDLRRNGKCEDAVAIFRGLADRGGGYEISQYNLGLCLLDLAAADPQHPASQRKEGADYILEAANGGFGKAQAAAVGLYLDGMGVDTDPVEAGKWAFVYHDNGMRLAVGMPDIAPEVLTRLNAVLTGTKRSEAHTRANAWTPSAEAVDH